MAGGSEGRSLAVTPSWVIATVSAVFVIISFMVERAIHRLTHWLKETKQKPLFLAMEKIKDELMLLGLMSLLVSVMQSYVVQICLPASVLRRGTPCSPNDKHNGLACGALVKTREDFSQVKGKPRMHARVVVPPGCVLHSRQRQPLISMEGIHQLHIFIFVLAVVHVVFSALTMALSRLRLRSWKKWEMDCHADNYDNLREHTSALTLNRQSTFLRLHTSTPWSKNRLLLWIVCFFRQFYRSVAQADYLALRLGFISKHDLDKKFDFYDYMLWALEDEYKEIVGISAFMWGYAVIFMLLNVHGTEFYFWIFLVPPLMLLIVGTKLQHVIATLAIEGVGSSDGYAPHTVQPRDELFWLDNPRFVLRLMHFILFQNAFGLATLIWFSWQFSFQTCFLERKAYAIIRLVLGLLVEVVCSYTTLPLYALVSQMGSSYKLGGNVKGALNRWKNRAQHRLGMRDETDRGSSREDGGSAESQSGRTNDLELQITIATPRVRSITPPLPSSVSTLSSQAQDRGGSE